DARLTAACESQLYAAQGRRPSGRERNRTGFCSSRTYAYGLIEGAAHLRRLAVLPAEIIEARLEDRDGLELRAGDAFDAAPALHVRQFDAARDVRVADDALGLGAGRERRELLEKALADHRDADIAGAEILQGAVRDRALPNPGDDVLVDDMARDPAPIRVLDRAMPGRDRTLHVGLPLARHPCVEPADAERVAIVDRHPPFEMVAEIKPVRPQRHAADRPVGVGLVGALAHALVDEAVLEFLELELEMARRGRTARALEAGAPILVHPFEMHRIAGVLLALEPVAGHFRDHDLGEAVAPGQRLPDRQLGRRLRPHIGPQQAAGLLHRIGARAAAILAAILAAPRRIDDVVIGLLDAAPVRIHQPAVIVAAGGGLLHETERHGGAPARGLPVE